MILLALSRVLHHGFAWYLGLIVPFPFPRRDLRLERRREKVAFRWNLVIQNGTDNPQRNPKELIATGFWTLIRPTFLCTLYFRSGNSLLSSRSQDILIRPQPARSCLSVAGFKIALSKTTSLAHRVQTPSMSRVRRNCAPGQLFSTDQALSAPPSLSFKRFRK